MRPRRLPFSALSLYSIVEVASFFVAHADDIGNFIFDELIRHLGDERCDLTVLARRLIPLRVRLLDNADEDAEIRIPRLGGIHPSDSSREELCISADLAIDHLAREFY